MSAGGGEYKITYTDSSSSDWINPGTWTGNSTIWVGDYIHWPTNDQTYIIPNTIYPEYFPTVEPNLIPNTNHYPTVPSIPSKEISPEISETLKYYQAILDRSPEIKKLIEDQKLAVAYYFDPLRLTLKIILSNLTPEDLAVNENITIKIGQQVILSYRMEDIKVMLEEKGIEVKMNPLETKSKDLKYGRVLDLEENNDKESKK